MLVRTVITIFSIFVITQTASPADTTAQSPIANTTAGKVRGYTDQGIAAFKGIPYGDDTARHRFQSSPPPVPWDGVRNCLEFGPAAPQPPEPIMGFYPGSKAGTPISEDCLHLNVWTPALRDGQRRPVMVWLHGGGFSFFSSNNDCFDGVRLCRRGDVVVVTLNHRLNGFGYLYLAELGEPKFADSGNVGQLDLILALKWVHDNIAEFGGDPDCVTIFGESGGGSKCATLMAMPAAHGLFHRVITQSGQQLTGRTREHGTDTARQVLKKLGLKPKQLGQLQTIPMDKLIAAFKGEQFYPVTDGGALPRDPFEPDASPLSAEIPMMLGNNHDETRLLIGCIDDSTFSLTWETLPIKLEQHGRQFMGNLKTIDVIAEYRRLYPSYTPSDVLFSATTAARSWKFLVLESQRRVLQNGAPTYIYQLDWSAPVEGGKWRAAHGLEIPLVFDNVAKASAVVGSGTDAQRMADLMSDAWIAFARTGNPNTPNLPPWPRFDPARRATMILNLTPRVEDDPRGEERKLFSTVTFVQPGT